MLTAEEANERGLGSMRGCMISLGVIGACVAIVVCFVFVVAMVST